MNNLVSSVRANSSSGQSQSVERMFTDDVRDEDENVLLLVYCFVDFVYGAVQLGPSVGQSMAIYALI